MFPNRRINTVQRPQQKPKEEGCKIKMKKTKDGKTVQFSKGCSKEQIKFLAKENGVDLEDN